MSGIVNNVFSKSRVMMNSPPAFVVNGAAQASSAGWPPAPLAIDDNLSGDKYWIRDCVLNASGNYVTLTYGGTYYISMEVRHDVGGDGATAGQNLITYLYVEEGAFVNTATHDYSHGITGTSGTRGDEDGAVSQFGGLFVDIKAGSHIWPGGFNRAGITTGLTVFQGVMIR